MKKLTQNDDTGLALLFLLLGVGLVTYRYVPFYGATPIALGVMLLIVHLVWRWMGAKS